MEQENWVAVSPSRSPPSSSSSESSPSPSRQMPLHRSRQENAMMPHLIPPYISNSSTFDIPDAPLFGQELGDALLLILNQLDPTSFAKFASTCRYTYDFCRNARGIQVLFGSVENAVESNDFYCQILVSKELDFHIEMFKMGGLQKWNRPERRFSKKEVEALHEKPFKIVIEEILFHRVQPGPRVMKKLTRYLRRFRSVVIEKLTLTFIREWSALAEFIQEFGVNELDADEEFRGRAAIPTRLLPIFLNRVSIFYYDGFVSDDLILAAKSRCLWLPEATISVETFQELVKKWEACEILCWRTGRRSIESDPFIKFCRESRENIQVDDIKASEMKPGFFYTKPTNPRQFFLVKNDGSVGSLTIDINIVSADMIETVQG